MNLLYKYTLIDILFLLNLVVILDTRWEITRSPGNLYIGQWQEVLVADIDKNG